VVRRRLTYPAVVMSAAPALSAVASVLRSEQVAISREALDAVRMFMTDGIDSPLYGRDPLAARRGADALHRNVVSGATAGRAGELAHANAV
jgi:hypothetical protein